MFSCFSVAKIKAKSFLHRFLFEDVSHKLGRYVVSSLISIPWYTWPPSHYQSDRHTIDCRLTKGNFMTFRIQNGEK